MQIAAVRAQRW